MAAPTENKITDSLSLSEDIISELPGIESSSSGRMMCERCGRPMSVCWCPFLPSQPLDISTNVWILQHPAEESRCLRTAPMLYYSLKPGKCSIIRGRRFSKERYPEVCEILADKGTVLLYPSSDAVLIDDLLHLEGDQKPSNLVILDGTWAQAKQMFKENQSLWNIKKVKLNTQKESLYVIRTQPSDNCLSTIESAAKALSILESQPELEQILIRPLVGMVDIQVRNGAVKHHSRDFQIENGIYKKQIRKSRLRKLAQETEERIT